MRTISNRFNRGRLIIALVISGWLGFVAYWFQLRVVGWSLVDTLCVGVAIGLGLPGGLAGLHWPRLDSVFYIAGSLSLAALFFWLNANPAHPVHGLLGFCALVVAYFLPQLLLTWRKRLT